MPLSARQIVSVVCNRHRNSDLRADDRDILAAFDVEMDAHVRCENAREEAHQQLIAERAAHQETLVGYRTIEALLGMLDHSEAVDEDVLIKTVNDKVSKLVTAHQETQAKLAEAQNEKLRCGVCNSPYGKWPDGVIRANRLEIELAETQAIAREILEAAIKYHDQQECAWCYDDGQCDLADLIDNAKAKGVLPAAPDTLPPAGSAASGDVPVSGEGQ